jgi:hypothetical protein
MSRCPEPKSDADVRCAFECGVAMISTLRSVWFRPAVLGGFGGMSDRSFFICFHLFVSPFGGGAVGEGCVVLKGNGLEDLLVVGEYSDFGWLNTLSCVGSGMCALDFTDDVSVAIAQEILDVSRHYLLFTYASLLLIR